MIVGLFLMDRRLLRGQASGGGSSQQLRHGQPLTPAPQGPLMFSAPTGNASSGGMMLYAQQSQSTPDAAMLSAPSPMRPSGSRTQSPAVNSVLQVSPPLLVPHAVVRAHTNSSPARPAAAPSYSCYRVALNVISCPALHGRLRVLPRAASDDSLTHTHTDAPPFDVCHATARTLSAGDTSRSKSMPEC